MIGVGGKPPEKPNQGKSGRVHEKKVTSSNRARSDAKKLKRKSSKQKSKEILPAVEQTNTKMKDNCDDDTDTSSSKYRSDIVATS